MSKQKLTMRGFYIIMVFAAAVSLFVVGFAAAAEKPGPKAATTAAKAVAKQAPKEQPQTGGILKIIEETGPKTPFGWPVVQCPGSTSAPILSSRGFILQPAPHRACAGGPGPLLSLALHARP